MLELYTTKELIEELVNRQTFAGVIIKSEKEVRNDNEPLNEWEIFAKNLSKEDVKNLLNFISHDINMIEE